MAGHVERGIVPGLVTPFSRRGETHVDAIGDKAAARDPMGRDTIFRIASMTKPITATAAMILVEECKLRLDEPVDRFLPELADRRVLKISAGPLDDTAGAPADHLARFLTFARAMASFGARPTISDSQNDCRSRYRRLRSARSNDAHGPDEWLRRLGTLPLMHQPGENGFTIPARTFSAS